MSSTATSGAAVVSPAERVEVLFEELAELAGQRNAIDGRIAPSQAAAAASIGPDPGPQYIRPELISGGNAPKSIPNPFSGCGVANDI